MAKQAQTTRILIRRAWNYSNVEFEITDENLTLEQQNLLRQRVALLVDEGIRELMLTVKQEEEIESLSNEALRLEAEVADYPRTEDGFFIPEQMDARQRGKAKRYRQVTAELANTYRYKYGSSESLISNENQ